MPFLPPNQQHQSTGFTKQNRILQKFYGKKILPFKTVTKQILSQFITEMTAASTFLCWQLRLSNQQF